MAHRIITQVVLTGAQIFGRAFIEAYQVASKSSAIAATGITTEESLKILNLTTKDKESIEKSYNELFKANDPANGGSFYLQSKVYRAREKLLEDLANK
jgi:import inner membrane translocase subunit TIM16